MWPSTVRTDKVRARAISLLDKPFEIRIAISRSRSVNGSEFAAERQALLDFRGLRSDDAGRRPAQPGRYGLTEVRPADDGLPKAGRTLFSRNTLEPVDP
jgi:hypothetical protein